MNLFDLYLPLASRQHSGEVSNVPYLLQPNFPLLLANTAFDFKEEAHGELEARFAQAGIPLSYTLPEGFEIPSTFDFRPATIFELCASQPSVRAHWTEHVPWSEGWTIAKIMTEAYGMPEWRMPFSSPVGKFLQNPNHSAFIAYLYGDGVGAVLTTPEAAILVGVTPKRLGNGVGAGLIGRIHPKPFLRMAGTEAEFPGQVIRRFVRYEKWA
jgi:hypothetical protein